MSTKSEATIDDLYKVDGKAEIVNGEIVRMSPAGGLPGYAAHQIASRLSEYEQMHRTGYAFANNVAFVVNLPNRRSFSPDAAFYRGEINMKFLEGAPVFAVEVRSESTYGPKAERAMALKRADYFAAGTLVVWDVDLLGSDVVLVYRASEPDVPTVYRREEVAEAEPAVPGWTMQVDDLFPRQYFRPATGNG